MDEYGVLTDYVSGEPIREATRDEWRKSVKAPGETGVFTLDDGRSVFVAGGPEGDDPQQS